MLQTLYNIIIIDCGLYLESHNQHGHSSRAVSLIKSIVNATPRVLVFRFRAQRHVYRFYHDVCLFFCPPAVDFNRNYSSGRPLRRYRISGRKLYLLGWVGILFVHFDRLFEFDKIRVKHDGCNVNFPVSN